MKPRTPTPGFRTTTRRLVLELSIVLSGVVLLGVGLWVGVRWAATKLAENLPLEADRALGQLAWKQLAPEDKRCTNRIVQQYVEAVLAPLLAHQPEDFSFEIVVVDDDSLNAFALPGGFVAVNFGLLTRIESSDELAGVLAHELGHVTQRHSVRRVISQLGTFALVGWAFGGTDIQGPAQLLTGLVGTAYAREQEAEADEVGLRVVVAAHADPSGMATLFERLGAEHPQLPELLSTHPDPGRRAARARSTPKPTAPNPLPMLPDELVCRDKESG